MPKKGQKTGKPAYNRLNLLGQRFNRKKSDMNHDDFLLWIHKVASRFMSESPQPDFYSAEAGVLVL